MPKTFAIFIFVRVGDKDRTAFYDDLLRHQIFTFCGIKFAAMSFKFSEPNLTKTNSKNLAKAVVKFDGSNLPAELVNLTALNALIGLKFDRFVANRYDLDIASAVWQI